jgi:hypothetical protein
VMFEARDAAHGEAVLAALREHYTVNRL